MMNALLGNLWMPLQQTPPTQTLFHWQDYPDTAKTAKEWPEEQNIKLKALAWLPNSPDPDLIKHAWNGPSLINAGPTSQTARPCHASVGQSQFPSMVRLMLDQTGIRGIWSWTWRQCLQGWGVGHTTNGRAMRCVSVGVHMSSSAQGFPAEHVYLGLFTSPVSGLNGVAIALIYNDNNYHSLVNSSVADVISVAYLI